MNNFSVLIVFITINKKTRALDVHVNEIFITSERVVTNVCETNK